LGAAFDAFSIESLIVMALLPRLRMCIGTGHPPPRGAKKEKREERKGLDIDRSLMRETKLIYDAICCLLSVHYEFKFSQSFFLGGGVISWHGS